MILTYHNIGDGKDKTWVSLDTFARQMQAIKDAGYQVVTLEEYDPYNMMHIVITFDDGRRNIFNATDIMKKYGFPFYVFVVGNNIGASDEFLSESDFDAVRAAGGILGWHTVSHPDLTKLSAREIRTELTNPYGFKHLAYPYWRENNTVVKIAKELGYTHARSGNGFARPERAGTLSMDSVFVQEQTPIKVANDKIVKFIDTILPTWPCNLRCHYCYVGQHLTDAERARVHNFKYSPDRFAELITRDRLGGTCVFNVCACGETLLHPQNVDYTIKMLGEGHFVGIVTNMTVTPNIDKLLALPKEYLSRLFFKCSFHYLELKKRGLLDTFVNNVNRAWAAGASITVEITPSDELEPYIDEVKEFSMKHFGALPHITIGRNELVPGFVRLTKHTAEEYEKIWGTFNSEMFRFKTSVWENRVKDFCYAGRWGYVFDFGDGSLYSCSCGRYIGDLADGKKLKSRPVCNRCPNSHCFNSHAWLAWGVVPSMDGPTYADMRDRVRTDGTHWLHPRVLAAFS